MKLKIIILVVIVLAILAVVYFAFIKKPSAASVVAGGAPLGSTAAAGNPASAGSGMNTGNNSSNTATQPTGITTNTGSPVGKNAIANKDGVKVYTMNNVVKKTVDQYGWVGAVTAVNGNMTSLSFTDLSKGWVLTGDVDLN